MSAKLLILMLVLPFFVVGCVSSGTYRKMEANRNQLLEKTADLDQELISLQAEYDRLSQDKAVLEKKTQETQSDYEAMLGQLSKEVQEGQLTIRQYKNMLSVDVAEKIFFASGRANIKASGQAVLKKVGEVLAQYPDKLIRVVGHTDNVPMAKSYQTVFPSNWELSAIRATNVVRFLQNEAGIPGERLFAVGRGEFQPIADNDALEGRQQNRRIEILLVDKQVQEAMETQ